MKLRHDCMYSALPRLHFDLSMSGCHKPLQFVDRYLLAPHRPSPPLVTTYQTIGQAYEEMQAQNRRLLEQISERDDYNLQLAAESMRARQLQASLQGEKRDMEGRVRDAAAVAEVHKQRVARLEEQVGGGGEGDQVVNTDVNFQVTGLAVLECSVIMV